MRTLLTSLFMGCAALVLVGPLAAQDTFTLGFAGPNSLSGNADQAVSARYDCTVTQEGEGRPAQGWSISMAAVGANVTGITLEGTDTERLFSGGFDQTETSDPDRSTDGCAGLTGAVSAIILSFGQPIVLDAATSVLAKIDVEATIPAGGGSAELQFVDNCAGLGQPVPNNVTVDGNSVKPVLGTKTINLNEIVSCCGDLLNHGFSASRVQSADPAHGSIQDPDGLCLGIQDLQYSPGVASVYVNLAMDIAEENPGVQGWSLSVAVDGPDGIVVATTTADTAGAVAPDGLQSGGFEQTENADPAKSGGQQGGVSAIILSFGQPIILPKVGTESLLRLDLEGADGDTATVRFQGGLAGLGQPVPNVITISGGSAPPPCNIDVTQANVTFAPPPGIGPFERGDPNDDGKNNIADAIWIINELFRGGPPTACQIAADANADDSIDVSDATYIIDYQFLGGPAPSAPFGDCGLVEIGASILTCEGGQGRCDKPVSG